MPQQIPSLRKTKMCLCQKELPVVSEFQGNEQNFLLTAWTSTVSSTLLFHLILRKGTGRLFFVSSIADKLLQSRIVPWFILSWFHTCAGVRVILLNCLWNFGSEVLRQANEKGMMGSGWAWVVTDGITGSVSLMIWTHDMNWTPREPGPFLLILSSRALCMGRSTKMALLFTIPSRKINKIGYIPDPWGKPTWVVPLQKHHCRNARFVAVLTFHFQTLQEPVPEYLQGLIGTKPSASHGTLWQEVVSKWNSLDPTEYPMAGPGTKLSVSLLHRHKTVFVLSKICFEGFSHE